LVNGPEGGREGGREGGKTYLEQECQDGGGALLTVEISLLNGPEEGGGLEGLAAVSGEEEGTLE